MHSLIHLLIPLFTQGALCVDVDECSRTAGVCGANSNCVNTNGGFSCKCHAPMVGAPPQSPCRYAITIRHCKVIRKK